MLGESDLKPTALTLRAYQVGFGDCFLLSFKYPNEHERHVLIDFGSTGMPEGVSSSEQMMKVAEDIKERSGGKLSMVVASHRHKDHISGFTTKEDGSGTGEVIASLQPDIVVQPWTEDPDAKDPATKKTKKATKGKKTLVSDRAMAATPQYVTSLDDMNALAEAAYAEVMHLSSSKFRLPLNEDLADQIAFMSEDNSLPNRLAVANLAGMGENHYVNYGYDLDLTKVLPGVMANFLGPPNLDQHAEIQKERAEDKNEFWMLQAAAKGFWQLQATTGQMMKDFSASNNRLFPDADVFQDFFPSHDRWFIRQLRTLRGQQLQGLVRILDKAMNNTSVILLLEVGGKKLLFPGDAQIENWEYALKTGDNLKLLKDVHLYKVGHHGSRNATPRTLWKNFGQKREEGQKGDRLRTVVSTMKGKHGHAKSHTEVPRATLIKELTGLSDYQSTENAAKKKELYVELEITL
ncbi:MAG: hypothetical protein AABM67_11340 [Acidobacteriota bacterium]